MNVRRYHTDDLEEIIKLFHDTVHNVNIQDYSQDQVDAWAPDSIDMAGWDKSLSRHHTFVAVEGSIIVGFGDIDTSGYLDRLYVHHNYQRQGVASAICDRLESAVEPGMTIITHASITAKPFFENRGYTVIRKQLVERKGVLLENYVMELLRPGIECL